MLLPQGSLATATAMPYSQPLRPAGLPGVAGSLQLSLPKTRVRPARSPRCTARLASCSLSGPMKGDSSCCYQPLRGNSEKSLPETKCRDRIQSHSPKGQAAVPCSPAGFSVERPFSAEASSTWRETGHWGLNLLLEILVGKGLAFINTHDACIRMPCCEKVSHKRFK